MNSRQRRYEVVIAGGGPVAPPAYASPAVGRARSSSLAAQARCGGASRDNDRTRQDPRGVELGVKLTSMAERRDAA